MNYQFSMSLANLGSSFRFFISRFFACVKDFCVFNVSTFVFSYRLFAFIVIGFILSIVSIRLFKRLSHIF